MNYFIRLIVYVCLYTWLVVGLGYGQCGKQVFNPETGLLDCTGVMGNGGGVGGAAALTTAGAIPLVSSAGTLTQDGSNLFWDNTNKRLGIGTASPLWNVTVKAAPSLGSNFAVVNASNEGIVLAAISSGYGYLNISSTLVVQTAGVERGRILVGGAWGIGTGNTAPTGTASILDRTLVTGATSVLIGTDGTNTSATTTQQVIRAGQAQSATRLTEWQANAGGVLAAVGPGGGFITAATVAETLANSQCTFHLASNTQLTFTCKGSDGTLRTNTLTLI